MESDVCGGTIRELFRALIASTENGRRSMGPPLLDGSETQIQVGRGIRPTSSPYGLVSLSGENNASYREPARGWVATCKQTCPARDVCQLIYARLHEAKRNPRCGLCALTTSDSDGRTTLMHEECHRRQSSLAKH